MGAGLSNLAALTRVTKHWACERQHLQQNRGYLPRSYIGNPPSTSDGHLTTITANRKSLNTPRVRCRHFVNTPYVKVTPNKCTEWQTFCVHPVVTS
ncbi:hypothetical protein BaRGS_00009283 [Batillaria attramentaria]|uniref:Uncharacterized protein n=1 Tax=Batillaria attramentaria TaxID=370345 RepID=A0ABD0LJC6_9CAEN